MDEAGDHFPVESDATLANLLRVSNVERGRFLERKDLALTQLGGNFSAAQRNLATDSVFSGKHILGKAVEDLLIFVDAAG